MMGITAFAGNINEHEQRLIDEVSAPVVYEGKEYVAKEEYVTRLAMYLNQDNVDLTAAQVDLAVQKFLDNIAMGIAEGYMEEVKSSAGNNGKPSNGDNSGTGDDSQNNNENNGNSSQDENDKIEDKFRQISEDTFEISADLSVVSAFEMMDYDDYDRDECGHYTLRKWMGRLLGRVPSVGSSCEYRRLEITAEKVFRGRLISLKFKVNPPSIESEVEE